MPGVAASLQVGSTSLWATAESLVHSAPVAGQDQQTVIPLNEIAGIELEADPNHRLLAASAILGISAAASLLLTSVLVSIAGLLGATGLIVAYDLTRGVRLTVRAPTATVQVRAPRDEAEDLATFAKHLESLQAGQTNWASSKAPLDRQATV